MADDGLALLTGPEVGPLLRAAVAHQGGNLVSWALEHVDSAPSASTTATYLATVAWPHGERTELLGVSARTGELSPSDERAHVFEDGTRRVAVWLYPNDPDLPGCPAPPTRSGWRRRSRPRSAVSRRRIGSPSR